MQAWKSMASNRKRGRHSARWAHWTALLAVAFLAARAALWDPVLLPYDSLDREEYDFIIVG